MITKINALMWFGGVVGGVVVCEVRRGEGCCGGERGRLLWRGEGGNLIPNDITVRGGEVNEHLT